MKRSLKLNVDWMQLLISLIPWLNTDVSLMNIGTSLQSSDARIIHYAQSIALSNDCLVCLQNVHDQMLDKDEIWCVSHGQFQIYMLDHLFVECCLVYLQCSWLNNWQRCNMMRSHDQFQMYQHCYVTMDMKIYAMSESIHGWNAFCNVHYVYWNLGQSWGKPCIEAESLKTK